MKITANAGELASVLALAASLSNDKVRRQHDAVHLAAADELSIAANVLDFALTQTVAANIVQAGEAAVSGSRLAALAAGFDAKAVINISTDEKIAHITCGRPRFKLPMLPIRGLPAVPVLDQEVGRVILDREDAEMLLRPAFAAANDERFYLRGILLRDDGDDLVAVATDGCRLARVRLPGATGLSTDNRLIVPSPALKIVGKLLAGRSCERVTLRRSRSLPTVEALGFSFTSKLIDADYPDFGCVIPKASGNTVTLDREEMLRALERLDAVADPGSKQPPVAGLVWSQDAPALRLCLADADAADDEVAATEITGNCRTAAKIDYLIGMLGALNGKRVCIDAAGGVAPFKTTDPDDASFLGVLSPFLWRAAP